MTRREDNFNLGRAVNSTLGGVFQNPGIISHSSILNEMEAVHNLECALMEYKRRLLSEVERL